MKCAIEGSNVKAFGKAVHALSRIGEDLWLDPLEKGLALRAVNSAHSAYACFLFSPLFFQLYSLHPGTQSPGTPIKCKLAMKSVLPLFRCLATIERNVDRCEISISTEESRVICQFYCRHGITKTHNLSYQESEALQAVFPTNLCPNVLKAQAKLLGDIVRHFPASQEEITLAVSPVRVILKNYYEEESDRAKVMYTEMSLHPDEFDYFQVGVDSHITFCLKELRGLLSFAESHSLPVRVHFGSSGKPVSFSLDDMPLTATVVLATLDEDASAPPSQTAPSQIGPVHRCVGAPSVPTSPRGTLECGGGEKEPEEENLHVAPQGGPVPGEERVLSSQASPVFSPALYLRKLLELPKPPPAAIVTAPGAARSSHTQHGGRGGVCLAPPHGTSPDACTDYADRAHGDRACLCHVQDGRQLYASHPSYCQGDETIWVQCFPQN
ncbi:cell cycle checkpoint control protein RAD9B isoform X2 [Alosa alosa]|uniref:cell cycle checkpoint control protein RAD9B isoform X2 n=1 Tax=Alosa alosa TaxID=278164 RepID=UPI002015282A|nr:cell cycle checkpoint control protein RAD9B isoform X2 [Alosa alosa]